ncbi:MAG: hypothetical protein SGJ05_08315 [bacterium]|nr:hypothetical protein [bacterium]
MSTFATITKNTNASIVNKDVFVESIINKAVAIESIVNKAILVAVAVLALFTSVNIQAQQPPNQPIDLPEFIVTGTERIEVPSSAKQPPAKPPALKAQILDSLNPTEKHPMPKIAARALPSPIRQYTLWPGYIEASMGNYITPNVLAGYSLRTGGYRVDLNAFAEAAASAWVPNAEYFKAGASLFSTYTAPQEFLVFGGSVTDVDLGFNTSNYSLYALTPASQRNTNNLHAGVGVRGAYEGFHYEGGASYTSTSMRTNRGIETMNDDVSDNKLRGYLALEQRWTQYDVGAKVDLRFQSFAGNSYPFMEGSAFARYSTSFMRLSAGAGVQSAMSTIGVSRFGVLVLGELDLFVGPDITVQANLRSGLRPITFASLLEENPYVNASAFLDAAYDVFDIRGSIVLRPSLALAVTAGIRLRQSERDVFWTSDRTGTFVPSYSTVTMLQIPADVRWFMTSKDVLTADLMLTTARIDSVDKPYVPSVRASLAYERAWTPSIRSVVAGIYVGDRFADLGNKITLSGYVDVRVRAEVDFTPTLSAHVRAENIVANTIVLWNGYAERGAFFSGGITWKF